MPFWLHFIAVLVLCLMAWISGMDANGDPAELSALWAAAALVGAHLVYRAVSRRP